MLLLQLLLYDKVVVLLNSIVKIFESSLIFNQICYFLFVQILKMKVNLDYLLYL